MFESLDYLTPGSVVYCPVRGIIAACARFAAIVEHSADTLLGARPGTFVHPDDVTTNEWLLKRALITKQPFVLSKRYLLKSGQTRWVESRYAVLASSSDTPLVSMLCRRIEAPEVKPTGPTYAGYIGDMCTQLAAMAQTSRLSTTAELLRLASRSAVDEDVAA